MDEQINDQMVKEEKQYDCCSKTKEGKGVLQGVVYGLIPHTGCIAFILFTIFGVSTATALFKPLLMNRYFFYFLMLLSFVFATISAVIYLTRKGMLSLSGLKMKWKYLSVMYGTTIGVNLVLFMLIFPLAANITAATSSGDVVTDKSEITLKVDIPCPGHAPLITEELKKLDGIYSVRFRFPNYFDVSYNPTLSQSYILSPKIFDTYKAEVLGISGENLNTAPNTESKQIGCSACSTCSGGCGGSCGGY